MENENGIAFTDYKYEYTSHGIRCESAIGSMTKQLNVYSFCNTLLYLVGLIRVPGFRRTEVGKYVACFWLRKRLSRTVLAKEIRLHAHKRLNSNPETLWVVSVLNTSMLIASQTDRQTNISRQRWYFNSVCNVYHRIPHKLSCWWLPSAIMRRRQNAFSSYDKHRHGVDM